jgi:hypothetical protein
MAAWAPLVYLLCLLTSATCAGLLTRGYVRNKTKFLLWSGLCFVLLALNNLLAVIDLLILPEAINLQILRVLTSLAAVLILLYGFIWEMD